MLPPGRKRGRQALFLKLAELATQTQTLNQRRVTGNIFTFQVVEQFTTLRKPCAADHDGCGDLFVLCKVALQVVDLCGQQCNLNFGRTAVVFATTKLRNDFALASTLRDIL